ncbi:MAG: hypothetical protein IJA29_08760, partial [Lachnospiraceae bacterium]|nr:hypothetical protein [Lachnospiraceae bacterium]
MSYILCSDGFNKFMDLIANCENGLENLENLIGEALVHVQEELHLGKAAMVMEVRPNMYQPHGRSICHDFYTYGKGYSTEELRESYVTGNKGVFHMIFHAEVGYTWNEEEQRAIRTLSHAIYAAMRRARLKELVDRAMLTDSMTMVSNAAGMKRFMESVMAQNKLAA